MNSPSARRFLGGSVLASLCVAGCGTVRLEVPAGRNVRMLEEEEPAEVRVQRTAWFWLWGAKAISDNSTRQEIEKYDLKEVRLQTEQTLGDVLITPLTALVSIVPRTMIVEGNPDRGRRLRGARDSATASGSEETDAFDPVAQGGRPRK